jgi:ribosomal-protein-alanine N-acetyltransferase
MKKISTDGFKFKTKRLIIRPLNKNDYKIWNEAIVEMLPPKNKWDLAHKSNPDTSKKAFLQMLNKISIGRINESVVEYAIIERSSNKLIGRCSLMSFVRSITQSAFVGYGLYNNYWGKGYAEEALNGLIQIAFKKHKLHRILAGIEPKNTRSLKLAKRLGMRREGIAKNVVMLRGEWRDLVQYALTWEDLNLKWKKELSIN